MLYPPILNKNNNVEKKLQTNSIYKHYITEYKKRNHKNEIKNLIIKMKKIILIEIV